MNMKFKIPYANNFYTHEPEGFFFSIRFPTAKRAAVPGYYFPYYFNFFIYFF